MLQFDAETTRILDTAYQGADITRRRRASFDVLAPGPGETILDIGCGNGLLTAELARAVGPAGKVIGIDPSGDMLASAKSRCIGFDQVELHEGTVERMPFSDNSIDKAVSLQVYEYLADLEVACAEAMRVLKPGGRLVVGDMHYDLFAWHSDNPERMARMRASWDQHFVWRDTPARLQTLLTGAGHVIETVLPVAFTDHVLKPDGLAMMMMHLMRAYAVSNSHLSQQEADAWFAEQERLADEGRFFFCMIQFVVVARKV